MAPPSATSSSSFSLVLSLLSLSLLTLENLSLVAARAVAEEYRVVSADSLIPATVCSAQKAASPSKLIVVHRRGPCSPLSRKSDPSHADLLRHDQARVDSINRLPAAVAGSLATTLPVTPGIALGVGNYIVSIGLGTPRKDFSVVFDTGSDLTWIQCNPCQSCYSQQDPIFDPAQSTTYANISCSSSFCNELDDRSCSSSSTCQYSVRYGDQSQTNGSFVQDTLTVAGDEIAGFRYGCGHQNSGLFGRADGLLGLGREPVSLVVQTGQKYGMVFSYCLPPRSNGTGYLTLGGSGGAAREIQYTPLLTNPKLPTFYFVKLVDIAVGGQRLGIPPAVFSASQGAIVDSGTVITRLPPAAYDQLRRKFQQLMPSYPRAPALSILDTCYDFTGRQTVSVPAVALVFDGGLTANLDFKGIIYVANVSQACLAFAGNDDPADLLIVGNVQQRTFNVVYDLASLRIGFGPNGC
ncbi:Protein aspartic protease in guard cell 2 [Apostasia shenzhenica]|uniref:Protein aspartic protease in guard cell 2 n=1 Tax=Apostasia shenzhenica TaxID=1088818 RepID=A0A2I0A4M0_9ASPA|nr:Protein aspartic protease in guard cell 2 [Apostasia shenzhenica]